MTLLFAHGKHIVHLILMFFNQSLKTIPPRKWIALLCNYYSCWHKQILKGGNFYFITLFLIFRPITMQCFANDHIYGLLMGHMHNIICYFISKRTNKVAKIQKFCRFIIFVIQFWSTTFSLSTNFLFLLGFRDKFNRTGPTQSEFLNLNVLIFHLILMLFLWDKLIIFRTVK